GVPPSRAGVAQTARSAHVGETARGGLQPQLVVAARGLDEVRLVSAGRVVHVGKSVVVEVAPGAAMAISDRARRRERPRTVVRQQSIGSVAACLVEPAGLLV